MQVDMMMHVYTPGRATVNRRARNSVSSPNTQWVPGLLGSLVRRNNESQRLCSCYVQWLHVLLADEFLCNRACKYRGKHGNASVPQTIPWQTATARVCASWEERDGKLICLVSKVSLPWCLPTLNLSIKPQALGPGHRFWLLDEAAFYKGAREEDEASLRSLNSFVTKDVWNSDPAVWHCYWEPREKHSCLLPVCMCLWNISDH